VTISLSRNHGLIVRINLRLNEITN